MCAAEDTGLAGKMAGEGAVGGVGVGGKDWRGGGCVGWDDGGVDTEGTAGVVVRSAARVSDGAVGADRELNPAGTSARRVV